MQELVIMSVAAAVAVGLWLYRKRSASKWIDAVSEYILNGEYPTQIPRGAVFLVPGGGGKRVAPQVAVEAKMRDPAAIIVSTAKAEERDTIRRILTAEGVDPSLIIDEPHAMTTVENAKFSAEANPFPERPVVIFKQRFHLIRLRELCSKFFAGRLVLAPVDPPGAGLDRAEREGRHIPRDLLEVKMGRVRDWPGRDTP